MIFVTLGSQKFQFNRILIEIDQLIEDKYITENVFAQTGYSDYEPKHYKYKKFLNRDEFSEIMSQSDTVITHGGTGAIIGAVKKGKKVVAIPRLSKYGEHVDDHQLQIVNQFSNMNLIIKCMDVSDLKQSLDVVKHTKLEVYHSNTDVILNSIDDYIKKIGG